MTHRTKPAPRPRYRQTYPDTLATTEQLRKMGLKPGGREPDAILDFEDRVQQISGTYALYLLKKAVPLNAPPDHPA